MQQTVAILGGGVAGLSAAHELAERGFQVRVYERKPVLGGKARSHSRAEFGAERPSTAARRARFPVLPGFLQARHRHHAPHALWRSRQHIRQSQRRDAHPSGQGRADARSHGSPAARQHSKTFRTFLVELFTPLGVPLDELTFFISRLLIVATSCPERRLAEFENIPWWDFIAAARMSKTYQAYLGQGLTRSLVAMRAEESSTRTVGCTQLQLLYGLISPGPGVRSPVVGSDQRRLDLSLDSVPRETGRGILSPELASSELKRMARA